MNKKKAFTLIELVVVMAIIAVLALLVVGAIVAARRASIETVHRSNGKAAQTALEAYYTRNRSYPAIAATTTCTSAFSATGALNDYGNLSDATSAGNKGCTIQSNNTAFSTTNAAGTTVTANYAITVYQYDGTTANTADKIVGP